MAMGIRNVQPKVHQLVVAEARDGGADPDVERDEEDHLGHEPEDGKQDVRDGTGQQVIEKVAEGRGRTAEKQQRGDAGDGDHVGVLGHEEHGELHRAVLGVIAGDKLGLGLGQIEGGAVGFGVGGHQVDEEGDDLQAAEDVPADEAVRRLRGNDGAQINGPGAQHDAHQRQAEGELIADQLGGGAQRAEERVLVVGAPAGERDAVDADGGDTQDDEQADVDVET